MKGLNDDRPDPDELLASLKNVEEKSRRGKLKIFFGMCAGVGKTYTMLQAAHAEKRKGADVVIGYVEMHNRKETSELVEGLEVVPRMNLEYKGTNVQEMDLDAIILRRPQIALVDELAHTNAIGSRHIKRYQDVQELLENGINVYTTINVQHLESRSETVAQITGIIVRETVPDEIFEVADEVELVDLTPEELLQRLSEGKVYTAERSREAVDNFFRKGNITALREMSLRIVADRVDKQLHDYMQQKRIRGPWKSGMHFLVAIGPSPFSGKLLRWAKTLSYSMGANIQALYVETSHKLTNKEREYLDRNINLAKQLGIKTSIITNFNVVKGIVDFANKENITHIVVGKPRVRNLYTMLRLGNFINKLIRYSGNIDVYILGSDDKSKDSFKERVSLPSFTSNLQQYFVIAAIVILSSFVCYQVTDYVGYQVISFMLLFLVSILAIFYGTGPILLAASLSALIWDYFFIPPQFTLHVENSVDVLMLVMFFIIALLNGFLTSKVRGQEMKTRIREERTQALYQLTRELSMAPGIKEVSVIAIKYIQKYFKIESSIILIDEQGYLDEQMMFESGLKLTVVETSIASWVHKHGAKAGKHTDTLPSTNYTFYPLKGNKDNMGVVVVLHNRLFTQGEELLWEAFLTQISGRFEREYLRNANKKAYLLNESDKLYKTLFNSISHELRIPISTIMGASETLISQDFPEETKLRLYHEVHAASVRLNQLIENLLNMSRLESGRIQLHYDWHDVRDLANKVAAVLKQELEPFKLATIIPPHMPLVSLDFGIAEQIIHNLVLNATQHAPTGSRIRMKFFIDNSNLVIQVMDRGKGFDKRDIPHLFDKFYRGKDASTGGTGLGLSIVKGFVEAHKGTVTAENRQNGGALFTVRMPVEISDFNLIKKDDE